MRLFRPTLRIRMALLYGGLVLLVGVSLLFTSVVLLNRSISQLPLYENSSKGQLTITDGSEFSPEPTPDGRHIDF